MRKTRRFEFADLDVICHSLRMTERKTPHPALVISTLTIAAISIAAVFWMPAIINWQIVP